MFFKKLGPTKPHIFSNLIVDTCNFSFDNNRRLFNYGNENKVVFIQGMKTSTTITIGDP